MRTFFIFLCLNVIGCAAELAHGDEDAAISGSPIETLGRDGDVTTTRVDATSDSEWIYMDLESGAQVTQDAAQDGDAWDIAFQRFQIMVNGGVSGEGGVEVAVLESAFDDVDEAPESGFITDAPDSDVDENDDPDLAFTAGDTGWYDYDLTTHTLSPRPFTYVVRTVERNVYKLAILDYYDDAGTSGFLTFEWAPLER